MCPLGDCAVGVATERVPHWLPVGPTCNAEPPSRAGSVPHSPAHPFSTVRITTTSGTFSRLSWLSHTPTWLRKMLLAPTRTVHSLHRAPDGHIEDYGPYCPCLRPAELCVTYFGTYSTSAI
jgi:hypothetical protein